MTRGRTRRRRPIAEFASRSLQAAYVAQIGYKPGASMFNSWQNSLMGLSMLIDQAELTDRGVILEYQLGNTSRRLDAMLIFRSATSAENAGGSES